MGAAGAGADVSPDALDRLLTNPELADIKSHPRVTQVSWRACVSILIAMASGRGVKGRVPLARRVGRGQVVCICERCPFERGAARDKGRRVEG